MKKILLIDDNTTVARNAADTAFNLAQKMKAEIITLHFSGPDILEPEMAGLYTSAAFRHKQIGISSNLGRLLDEAGIATVPDNSVSIRNVYYHDYQTDELARLIIKEDIWMIIQGMPDGGAPVADRNANLRSILHRVKCPMLLVPEHYSFKGFEKIVYATDLRYCRLGIAHYLNEIARSYRAALTVSHISAKGLPHMEENYARDVFTDGILNNLSPYDGVYFDNIRERDLRKTIDVMINGMHTDLLVLVNHRFHFQELLGERIPDSLPAHLPIPLLIFPC